jgi:outer membrane protein assembly factor BamE (lipoprotein component of BamABCDE complex)
MKSRYILCAALSLVLMGCGGGSPLTLNQENFNKVQDDMSQSQVRDIMGAPTSSDEKPIPIVGGQEVTYTYSSDKATATVVFKNDKVTDKKGSFNP